MDFLGFGEDVLFDDYDVSALENEIYSDNFSPIIEDIGTNNIAFFGTNSDGYIPDGKVTLERTISGSDDTFSAFRKGSHIYVETSPNHYVQVDGVGTVKINGVMYDKV